LSAGDDLRQANFLQVVIADRISQVAEQGLSWQLQALLSLSLTAPIQLAVSLGPRAVVGYDQKVY